MAMIPQINNSILPTTTNIQQLPSRTYKLNLTTGRISGFIDGIEAIQQSVYHILKIERYANIIYNNNYGIELLQYIGNGFDYLESTIQDTLKKALKIDLRIKDVIVTDIIKKQSDIAEVKFDVMSIYGNLQMEVSISV